jgi:hypothetical protein
MEFVEATVHWKTSTFLVQQQRVKRMSSFKEQYLEGVVDIAALDDFVEQWHKHPKGSLKEYLGLTDYEYELFAHSEIKFKQELDKQKGNHQAASVLKALSKLV